jgi:hypothetical protein
MKRGLPGFRTLRSVPAGAPGVYVELTLWMVTAIETSGDCGFTASSPTYLEGAWVESDFSATALCIHGSQNSRAKGRTAMSALLTIFFLSKRFR